MKRSLLIYPVFFLLFLGSGLTSLYAQQENISDFLIKTPQIVYFGIDFSHAQIIRESPKHIKRLQDSLLQKINLDFLSEQIGWLKYKLSKDIIVEDKLIHSQNSEYSNSNLPLDNDSIQKIIKAYTNVNKAGTGLVFFVENLDKPGNKVELYAVFFDISSKTVLWVKKESGTAHGGAPGLMQFWRPKVYSAISEFIDTYKSLKAEKTVNIKPNNIFLKLFIDELSVGYERMVDPDLNISFEAGYRLNYLTSWDYIGNPIPVEYFYRFLSFHGFTFRVAIKCKITKRSYFAPVFAYQRLYCPRILWYPDGYGGSDDGEYKVYSQHNDEFVVQFIHFINLGYSPYKVQFFYGVGVKVCALSQHYSIDGSPDNRKPSDKYTRDGTIQPLITFGLSIKLGSF